MIDTGSGIPPDALDKIFHAYYSTKRGGTGLGLAMAQRIVQEHGGKLTVSSEPGKGSDFTLRLPFNISKKGPCTRRGICRRVRFAQLMSESQTPKATVLLVDDERDHAQVMCEALERQGHRCDVTYSLTEAEARLRQKSYDVIVTDLVMEGSATAWKCCTRPRR